MRGLLREKGSHGSYDVYRASCNDAGKAWASLIPLT